MSQTAAGLAGVAGMVLDNAISVCALKKHYGETKAVDGVTFEVLRGEIFGMLGPNGAGKTTTVECVEGLRQPDSGSIAVFGLRHEQESRRIKSRVGVQLQTTGLYPKLTVRELIALFTTFYPHTQPVDALIDLVDLGQKASTRSKDLSGGQRQRLSLALALVNDPELVFLDEPTTGLDPQARRSLWDVVRELKRRGKTVLLTTHYMDEAEQLCDRVAVMDQGRIIELDTPAGLINKHFQETAIEFVPRGAWDRDRVAGLDGVMALTVEDGHVHLYSSDVPHTMASLFRLVTEEGLAFKDMTVRQATLEDVFLKLTGRRIRE